MRGDSGYFMMPFYIIAGAFTIPICWWLLTKLLEVLY